MQRKVARSKEREAGERGDRKMGIEGERVRGRG